MPYSSSSYWDALLTEGSRRLGELELKEDTMSAIGEQLVALDAQMEALLKAYNIPDTFMSSEMQTGGVAVARASAARMVALCCAQRDGGSQARLNSMPDPQLEQLNALISAGNHEAALDHYMQLDMPCLRWAGVSHASGEAAEPSPASFQDDQQAPQALLDARAQLQRWAARRLLELNRDGSPTAVHAQLLRGALANRGVMREKPDWWKVVIPPDEVPKRLKLAAAVFGLAPSSDAAWGMLQKALWHGLAPEGGGVEELTPVTFEEQRVDLEQAHQGLLDKTIRAHLPPEEAGALRRAALEGGVGTASNPYRKLQEELGGFLAAVTPVTYLQLVGQKILYHAAIQLPVLASLPEEIDPRVVCALYTQPFIQAVNMALSMVCESSDNLDPTPFAPKAAEGQDQRRWRILQSVSVPAGDARNADGKGPRSSLKTLLNVIKGICRDVVDFEQGLSTVLDSVPEALYPGGASGATGAANGRRESSSGGALMQSQASAGDARAADVSAFAAAWQLRCHSLRGLVKLELECALAAQRSSLGALLVTTMTRGVRTMLAAGGAPQEQVSSEVWPESDPLAGALDGNDSVAERRLGEDGPEDEEEEQPRYIDGASNQVLSFVTLSVSRLPTYPDMVQALLAVAVLEVLGLLLDHLAPAVAPAHALPGPPTAPARTLLLYHGAARCVRRRLLAFRVALELPLQDDYYEAMLRGYANTLLQAEDLVASLSQAVVRVHCAAANTLVWAPVDATPWGSHRRPLKRPRAAGDAPRVWRCSLARLVHGLVQASSPGFSSWVLGQVLQEGLAAAVLRYGDVSPSAQHLPRFVADALHITFTCASLAAALRLPSAEELLLAGAVAIGGPASHLHGYDHDDRPAQLRVAPAVSAALARACRALATRAALLACPPGDLGAALAGLPRAPAPPAAAAARSRGASHSGGAAGGGGAAGSRDAVSLSSSGAPPSAGPSAGLPHCARVRLPSLAEARVSPSEGCAPRGSAERLPPLRGGGPATVARVSLPPGAPPPPPLQHCALLSSDGRGMAGVLAHYTECTAEGPSAGGDGGDVNGGGGGDPAGARHPGSTSGSGAEPLGAIYEEGMGRGGGVASSSGAGPVAKGVNFALGAIHKGGTGRGGGGASASSSGAGRVGEGADCALGTILKGGNGRSRGLASASSSGAVPAEGADCALGAIYEEGIGRGGGCAASSNSGGAVPVAEGADCALGADSSGGIGRGGGVASASSSGAGPVAEGADCELDAIYEGPTGQTRSGAASASGAGLVAEGADCTLGAICEGRTGRAGGVASTSGAGPVAEGADCALGAAGRGGIGRGGGGVASSSGAGPVAEGVNFEFGPIYRGGIGQGGGVAASATSGARPVAEGVNFALGAIYRGGGSAGGGAPDDAAWSWLPGSLLSQAAACAAELVSAEQLVRGFDPRSHMDTDATPPVALVLAADAAEAAMHAKQAAASAARQQAGAGSGAASTAIGARSMAVGARSMAVGAHSMAIGARSMLHAGMRRSGGGGGASAGDAKLLSPSPSAAGSRGAEASPSPALLAALTDSTLDADDDAPSPSHKQQQQGRGARQSTSAARSYLTSAAWKLLLSQLVEGADTGAALVALAHRHELMPMVDGLPYSAEELAERAAVHELAAQHLAQPPG
ncbi:hypothetical protein FOA52_007575 [Chlamydomonas sp. UWO 241]|nr:hypothetical protein FOA52_007575 [Chlamydomonas sp. UWO 241]